LRSVISSAATFTATLFALIDALACDLDAGHGFTGLHDRPYDLLD
jgi:hypothetical protein